MCPRPGGVDRSNPRHEVSRRESHTPPRRGPNKYQRRRAPSEARRIPGVSCVPSLRSGRFDKLNDPDLAFRDVPARLARFLVRQAEQRGVMEADGCLLPLRLGTEDIACLLGTTRQSVSSQMNQWQREGLLTRRSRHALLIHDPKFELAEQKQQELDNIRRHTRLIVQADDLETLQQYPAPVRKLLTRLSRVRMDRLLNRIL